MEPRWNFSPSPDSLAYLAHALDTPAERLGARAPELPTWFCSVRSDPRRPDLTDSQWATVARRLVTATGIVPAGDPDACGGSPCAISPGRCTS